jgi:hypothetical protein
MSDELKEGNILKLILIMRFVCATLDVGHPIFKSVTVLDLLSSIWRTLESAGIAFFLRSPRLFESTELKESPQSSALTSPSWLPPSIVDGDTKSHAIRICMILFRPEARS